MTVSLPQEQEAALVPIEQDPHSLLLGVLEQPYLPLGVRVLRERRVELGGLVLQLRIIGESHWVSVEHAGRAQLQEVLACVPLPVAACSIHHTFSSSQSCFYRRGPYSVRVSFETLSHALSARGTEGDYLQVNFPQPAGWGDSPCTRIWWTSSGSSALWWTMHTYSTERGRIAVLSESRYERSPVL